MTEKLPYMNLITKLQQRPHAWARLCGSRDHPNLSGNVYFYQTKHGVLVSAEASGLPNPTGGGFFGFHIHEGFRCSGNEHDPFADALTHYNPSNFPHPYHAGNLPPLLGHHGRAFQVFLTDRFSVSEIVHKTVVIHSRPDDFTSQPAGNAGDKIACGQIKALHCR